MNSDSTANPSRRLRSDLSSDLAREIDEAVAGALADCGRSAAWRSYVGTHQTQLVAALQQVSGAEHVGLASSGTAALEMLLSACRLRSGDEVLLAGYDYPGTFAAIERAGARPALVDVAPQSWSLSWESLQATVTPACRVLIASHLHGELQPIAELERWCAERDIWLIQDACQALGASIDSRPIGQFGDATIFSFGGGKTVSAGRGGAWVTRDPKLAQHARLAAGVGSGTNAMSELQAAVVGAQLPFLARLTERCRHFFAHVRAALAKERPEALAPWQECVKHTAFYQAGWLLPRDPAPSVSVEPRSENQAGAEIDTSNPSHDHNVDPPARAIPSAAQSLTGTGHIGSPLIGLSQSQHAELQRIGIGSGFPGYHRRSTRRCRIHAPLQNTARVAGATVTVHHRAALLDAPVAEALAQFFASSIRDQAAS